MLYVLRFTFQLHFRADLIPRVIDRIVLHSNIAVEDEPIATRPAGEVVASAVVEDGGASAGLEEHISVEPGSERRAGSRSTNVGDASQIAATGIPLRQDRVQRCGIIVEAGRAGDEDIVVVGAEDTVGA